MIIKNCRIISESGISEPKDILIENGLIKGTGTFDSIDSYDAHDNFVCSGFIDIHTHGGYGADFMDATEDAFDTALKFHADNGTTSVLATSCTSPTEQILSFVECAREYKRHEPPYAKLLGVHLEGPFLSVKNRGAQKQEYLMSPDTDSYEFILKNKDVIKTVTISPELVGADIMTKKLSECGIIVCGGHDDGIYPEFMPSVNAGLKHLTHIYCAMSELRFKNGARNVGLREYGLIDNRLSCEIIADNKHMPSELVHMILKCKGANKTALVSDSLRCAGMPIDNRLYKLGCNDADDAQSVKVADGVAVISDGSRFAGSITPIHQMIKNLIDSGIDITDAVAMGTSTPANIIGADNIGRIFPGYTADICILNEKFDIIDVFKDGELMSIEH